MANPKCPKCRGVMVRHKDIWLCTKCKLEMGVKKGG